MEMADDAWDSNASVAISNKSEHLQKGTKSVLNI